MPYRAATNNCSYCQLMRWTFSLLIDSLFDPHNNFYKQLKHRRRRSGDKAETKLRCCRCHTEEASQTNRRTPWICSGRLHTNPPFEDLLQLSRWNMPLSATAWWFRVSVAAWASAAWAEAPRQLLKLARSLSALSLRLSVTRLLLLLLLLRLCHKNSFTVSHCWHCSRQLQMWIGLHFYENTKWWQWGLLYPAHSTYKILNQSTLHKKE